MAMLSSTSPRTLGECCRCKCASDVSGVHDLIYLQKRNRINKSSINCDSKRYTEWYWFAIIMVIIYPVGIPSLFLVLVWVHRDVLTDPQKLEEEKEKGYPTIGHLLFLTQNCELHSS